MNAFKISWKVLYFCRVKYVRICRLNMNICISYSCSSSIIFRSTTLYGYLKDRGFLYSLRERENTYYYLKYELLSHTGNDINYLTCQ